MPAYTTDRLQAFRSTHLDEQEKKTISSIEEFGHEVIVIGSSPGLPGWAFTVGLHDTAGKPELIVIGLKDETAHSLLNDAANRLRQGVDLATGRHQGFLEGAEIQFRPVDPKWVDQVMGWAAWYNDGDAFPVLQAIYPDRANRFPGEPGFNRNFSQPLLQPGHPMGRLEDDFWASSDPASSFYDWSFPDPPHTGAYLSEAVREGSEPVTYVSHDLEDGKWQFMGDSMTLDSALVTDCLHRPVDRDASLKELADLPLGWYAERKTPTSPWIRREHRLD